MKKKQKLRRIKQIRRNIREIRKIEKYAINKKDEYLRRYAREVDFNAHMEIICIKHNY